MDAPDRIADTRKSTTNNQIQNLTYLMLWISMLSKTKLIKKNWKC